MNVKALKISSFTFNTSFLENFVSIPVISQFKRKGFQENYKLFVCFWEIKCLKLQSQETFDELLNFYCVEFT